MKDTKCTAITQVEETYANNQFNPSALISPSPPKTKLKKEAQVNELKKQIYTIAWNDI